MPVILFHAEADEITKEMFKVDWMVCEGSEIVKQGEVFKDSPCYLLEFVNFLLAMGEADILIGYHMDYKLRSIGKAMKTYHFQISVERKDKIIHLDLETILPDSPKPKNINDVYEIYMLYKKDSV